MYEFAEAVLADKRRFYAYHDIALLRSELKDHKEEIEFTDYGAGSRTFKSNKRKVSDIVKNMSVKPKEGELLFKLVNYFKPQTILELGTCLGLGTLYLSMPLYQSKVITIEGCQPLAEMAHSYLSIYGRANVEVRVGQFKDELGPALADLERLDMAFIDGHHQKDATLAYFEQCLAYTHEDSVLIFDDIYWSEGMMEAWEAIKAHPKVTLTLDFFELGIVFFRKDRAKEHFKLYYF